MALQLLKRLAPRTLFGRALLIIVALLVLAQLVAAWVFYDRVWDSVTRRMAAGCRGRDRGAGADHVALQRRGQPHLAVRYNGGADRRARDAGGRGDPVQHADRGRLGHSRAAAGDRADAESAPAVRTRCLVAAARRAHRHPASRRRAARGRRALPAVHLDRLYLPDVDDRLVADLLRDRVGVQRATRCGRSGVWARWRRNSARAATCRISAHRVPPRCARRRRRSSSCASAFAASSPSARRCWPASATICARRSRA